MVHSSVEPSEQNEPTNKTKGSQAQRADWRRGGGGGGGVRKALMDPEHSALKTGGYGWGRGRGEMGDKRWWAQPGLGVVTYYRTVHRKPV